jgi:hypothetical protein
LIPFNRQAIIDPLEYPMLVTRSEDIEVDDVHFEDSHCSPSHSNSEAKIIPKSVDEKGQPLPWGTLRITDSKAQFRATSGKANLLAVMVFSSTMYAYWTIIRGELNFFGDLEKVYSLILNFVCVLSDFFASTRKI